ncbi:MAG: FAD-binding oxidoreductase [Candidatus Thorarchaeota archaeon]|nr:MAG: FAD-binding oxidoreductase [Candidatus Thorarchaeota archaeon]
MDSEIIDNLRDIAGAEFVSTREDVLLAYSSSASMGIDPVQPGAVVRPSNADEVAAILRIADEHGIPVTIRAGGTSLQGEVTPKADGLVVELMRLNKIELFKDLRTVRVGAGVTFGELDKFLSEHDLWLPVSPESALACTVAGNVAVNGSGPGSSFAGCIGELVMGLEIVLPNSQVIQTGSEANPNAPGPFLRYAFGPDITGIFIGSLGSLGVITSVSVKVFKRMEHFDYNTYGFDSHEQAEKFLVELKDNDVNMLMASLYEGPTLEFFMDMVGEEFGIPPMEWPHRTVSMTIGRVRKDVLESDAKLAREICEKMGGRVIGIVELPKGEWDGRFWTFVRCSYVHPWAWQVVYHHQAPTNVHRSVEEITKIMDKYAFLGHTAGFASGHSSMNMYPQFYWDPVDEEERKKVVGALKELAGNLYKAGAVPFKLASYWDGLMEGTETYMELLRRLKETIDPNGIMNKGVLGGI